MNSVESNNPGRPKIKAFLEALMPPMLSFGPIFMVIGLQSTRGANNGLSLMGHLYALTGALALSLGLSFLWTRQVGLLRRLDELEKARA